MRIIVIAVFSCLTVTAQAGVYKCVNDSGKTVYKSTPCSDEQSKQELNLKTGVKVDLAEKEQAEKQQHQLQKEQAQQNQQEQNKVEQIRQKAADENAKSQFLIKNHPEQFSSFAIPAYKSDNLPAFAAGLANKLPEIERLRRVAAEKALATGQCKRVEASELSEKTSENEIFIRVNCSSAKTFEFSAQQLPDT